MLKHLSLALISGAKRFGRLSCQEKGAARAVLGRLIISTELSEVAVILYIQTDSTPKSEKHPLSLDCFCRVSQIRELCAIAVQISNGM